MPEVLFGNLLAVAVVAVVAPWVAALAPRLRVPAVVLEIVAGIVLGPSGLGWISLDLPVEIVALLGLAFLLFLAGLEVDVHQLRGPAVGARRARVRDHARARAPRGDPPSGSWAPR